MKDKPLLTRSQYEVLGELAELMGKKRDELAALIAMIQDQVPSEVSEGVYDDYSKMSSAVNRVIGRILKLQLETTHALGGVKRSTT